jgi:hypothetical protein
VLGSTKRSRNMSQSARAAYEKEHVLQRDGEFAKVCDSLHALHAVHKVTGLLDMDTHRGGGVDGETSRNAVEPEGHSHLVDHCTMIAAPRHYPQKYMAHWGKAMSSRWTLLPCTAAGMAHCPRQAAGRHRH